MPTARVIAKGLVEKIGLKGSAIKHTNEEGTKITLEGDILDHQQGSCGLDISSNTFHHFLVSDRFAV